MFNLFKKNLTEAQIKQMDQTIEKFKKNPHQFRFTVIFFFTSVLFGILTIYLLQQKFALLMQKNGKVEIKEIIKNVPVPPPDVTLEPTTEATQAAQLDPTAWQLKKNEDCNVLVPVSPYQSNNKNNQLQTWKATSSTSELSSNSAFLNLFNKKELIGFTSDDQPTETARLVVLCADNPDNKSLQDLKYMISTKLTTEETFKDISIVSSLEKTYWNRPSLELIFSGSSLDGQVFYATVTNKHFYLVSKQITTSDETVKKDADRIINGLIFLD